MINEKMENNNKELAIARVWVNIKSRAIAETSIATVIAVIVPAILAHTPQNQFIVGPIVNAVLFWVALRVGITNALFIAVIPSLIALFRGMLPPTAAMVIPFIILGNCTMILVFTLIKSKLWLRVLASSVLKTLVIFLPAWLLFNLSSTVSFMMSWPQLLTAVVGGFIAVKLSGYLNSRGSNT
jgi:hypothetical protein